MTKATFVAWERILFTDPLVSLRKQRFPMRGQIFLDTLRRFAGEIGYGTRRHRECSLD